MEVWTGMGGPVGLGWVGLAWLGLAWLGLGWADSKSQIRCPLREIPRRCRSCCGLRGEGQKENRVRAGRQVHWGRQVHCGRLPLSPVHSGRQGHWVRAHFF